MPKYITTTKRLEVYMLSWEMMRQYNGRRGRHELLIMMSMQREVHSYRLDNKKIMKSQEDILQSMNML
jgi:hypothetical protein